MVRHHATVHPLWEMSQPPSTRLHSRYVLPSPLTSHPHTDHAPALSIHPPAIHLTSPAPSRATATPPIARTHATPCADCPHRHSLPSSCPVVCRTALPLPLDANLTPQCVHLPSLSIHLPATCPIRAAHPLYVPPTVHAALHADLLPGPLYMPHHCFSCAALFLLHGESCMSCVVS